MTTLQSLQREMAAAVMQPLTPDDDMRAATPDGRATADVAASFIAPNSRLTPFERLEIYNRQYWFRVLGALAEDFPALRAIVGGRAFHALSVAYLVAHPSRSFTLRNLGSTLVEWLASNPQFAARRHRLAVDVARIEWAFIEAFDSAERDALTLDQIAMLDANSRLALQPHLRLIALEYPADDLVLSLHRGDKRQATEAGVSEEEAPPEPANLPRLRRRPTWVAAHRIDNSVYYRRLAREEFLVLTAIRSGSTLAQALDAGFSETAGPKARGAQRVRGMFSNWAELGWVCSPELESLIKNS